MNREFSVSIVKMCRLLGVSRQSYYQHKQHQNWLSIEHTMIVDQVKIIRASHRYMGTRKLYEILQPFLMEHQIKIGRDGLFDMLSKNKLLVRRRKRKAVTTNSYHRYHKWPNIAKFVKPSRINELWVSDITYWKLGADFCYISFITDAFSHKIVGYHLAENLKVIQSIKALKMALNTLNPDERLKLTHHSDRGVQYCSDTYIYLLQNRGVQISMTENSDPRENAIAERINGIIKSEYLLNMKPKTIQQAFDLLDNAIRLYNQERPHMCIGMLTPNRVHHTIGIKPVKLWKNYYDNTFKK
jgi:putative transposase